MFLDLGCSHGGSLIFGKDTLRLGEGIGVDLDTSQIESARALGLNVIQADCCKLKSVFRDEVDFCLASHFLEHVQNLNTAHKIIYSALSITKKAVFIQQPSFDGMDYFNKMGVKLFFSDWSGHPNMMTTSDWFRIIEQLIDQKMHMTIFSYHY